MEYFRKLTLLLLSCFLFSCSENSVEEKKILVMGVTADYPPFEFMEQKKLVGFDIDLGHLIADEMGQKLEIKDMDFDSLIPALQTGRIDFIISGLSNTPEREKNISFSIPYYATSFAMIYENKDPIKDINDFAGKSIAVQLGSTMESFIREYQQEDPTIKIIPLARIITMIQELKLSRVDGVLVEEAEAKRFIEKYPELKYSLFPSTDRGYSIGFAKNSPLRAKVDAILIKLINSGKINKLKEKWLI